MLARGGWAAIFNVSVFILLALEIAGCSLGTMLLGGRRRNNKSTPGLDSKSGKQNPKLFSSEFDRLFPDGPSLV
jgi:hypothetical protein